LGDSKFSSPGVANSASSHTQPTIRQAQKLNNHPEESTVLPKNDLALRTNSNYSNTLNVSIQISDTNESNLNTSDSNLNGLLNVVKSINPKVTVNKLLNYENEKRPSSSRIKTENISSQSNTTSTPNADKTTKSSRTTCPNSKPLSLENSACLKCSLPSKVFCKCNISKAALDKLYKNYSGFLNANNNMPLEQGRKNGFVIFETDLLSVEKIFQVL
jgi:hypothetical protein